MQWENVFGFPDSHHTKPTSVREDVSVYIGAHKLLGKVTVFSSFVGLETVDKEKATLWHTYQNDRPGLQRLLWAQEPFFLISVCSQCFRESL